MPKSSSILPWKHLDIAAWNFFTHALEKITMCHVVISQRRSYGPNWKWNTACCRVTSTTTKRVTRAKSLGLSQEVWVDFFLVQAQDTRLSICKHHHLSPNSVWYISIFLIILWIINGILTPTCCPEWLRESGTSPLWSEEACWQERSCSI